MGHPRRLISRIGVGLACGVVLLAFLALLMSERTSAAPDSGSAPAAQGDVHFDERPVAATVIAAPWPARPRLRGYEYNQKSHHAPPEFVERGGFLRSNPGTGARYRVVGFRFDNHSDTPVTVRYRSRRVDDERFRLTVPAEGYAVRYHAAKVEPELQWDLEAERRTEDRNRDATIVDARFELGPARFETRDPREARSVALELSREDRVRRELAPRPVEVWVRDDFNRPVAGARVVLLRDEGLYVLEGETDGTGQWTGSALPGGYEVHVFRTIPPRKRSDDQTAVLPRPRLLVLRGRIEADSNTCTLEPTETIEGHVHDVDQGSLSIQRIWVTPSEFAPSYRFATMTRALGSRARVVYTANQETDGFFLLTNRTGLELTCHAEVTPNVSVLLRGQVPVRPAGTPLPETVSLVFDPANCARTVFDPPAGAGEGEKGRFTVNATGRYRESFTVECNDLHTCYLFPGEYRFETVYRTRGGSVVDTLPYRRELAAGSFYDLTPREPFEPSIHYERIDDKMQFWLAVTDGEGRVLRRPPGNVQRFSRDATGVVATAIGNPRWELAAGAERVSLDDLFVAIELEFDGTTRRGKPKLLPFERASAKGATGQAPSVLKERLASLLPAVKSAVDGSRRFLDLPPGGRNQHMNFDVLLPPGVGGLGGGDTITLDIAALFPFACETDAYPGAFRHELGHCLGFGHDPYMLLAPTGVDEQRFGATGYRMLHAASFERSIRYLETDRSQLRSSWQPNDAVFPTLRMLYGEEVHRRMFQERKTSEKTLTLHGLSSIERIACLYSLALDRNVAWVFRALGWPVTDDAIDRGAGAVGSHRQHPPQLNYARVQGTPLTAWWVYGPLAELDDESSGWRRVEWPSRFLRLDEDREPSAATQSYLLYRTVTARQAVDARILCASDVQLEIRVNGTAIANIDASPQLAQPLHDEQQLDQKKPYWVTLFEGENVIEVAVNQPPGTRGFTLEWITPDGQPLPLGLGQHGPPGESLLDTLSKLSFGDVVLGGGFDRAADGADWIRGPVEGRLRFARDSEEMVSAPGSLRVDAVGPGRGGMIQRVVVEPGKRYRLSAAMRSRGLEGKAYVSLFATDVHTAMTRLDGFIVKDPPGAVREWRQFEATWAPGQRRVVYVACYVEASAGQVWFDNVSLVPLP